MRQCWDCGEYFHSSCAVASSDFPKGVFNCLECQSRAAEHGRKEFTQDVALMTYVATRHLPAGLSVPEQERIVRAGEFLRWDASRLWFSTGESGVWKQVAPRWKRN